jgi:hypothetical protein
MKFKAILITYESPEDSQTHPIATFDDDQTELMQRIFSDLQADIRSKQKGEDYPVSVEIGEWNSPPHNPQSIAELK